MQVAVHGWWVIMAVHLNLLTESLTEKFHVARSYQAHPSTTSVFSVCFGVGVYFGGYMTVYDTPTILQPTYVLASFHKKKISQTCDDPLKLASLSSRFAG